MLIDYVNKIAFTGDIYVNLKGFSDEQKRFNRLAPILMTSVDTEKKLCADERQALLSRLGVGEWKVFGGHGQKKDFKISLD